MGTFLVTDNQISNFTIGISLDAIATSTGNFLVQSNRIEAVTTGIFGLESNTGAFNLRALDNTIDGFTTGINLEHGGNMASSTSLALIRGNTFENGGVGEAINALFSGDGLMSLIVQDNTDTDGADGSAPYFFEQGSAIGNQCVRFTGNNTDRTTKEVVFDNSGGGTLQVEELNDIESDNNDIVPVTPSGGVTSVDSGTCPFPPPIP